MKALVLAAGQGTRLRQLARNRPKALLPIGGKPLLVHTLAWLRDAGISEVAINLHHCPQAIPGTIGDGSGLGLSVRYSYEAQLLGSAGAAKRLQSFFDESFVVVYGDLLTEMDLGRLLDFHTQQRRLAPQSTAMSLSLYRVSNPTQCGLVDLTSAGRVVRFVEKPAADQVFTDLAFSGVLVCEPTIFDFVPPNIEYDFGHDLFPKLLTAGHSLWGQEIAADELIIDIGTLNGYFRALQSWAAHGVPSISALGLRLRGKTPSWSLVELSDDHHTNPPTH
jgi:NDP-sugar pyrophosphorylase family protein